MSFSGRIRTIYWKELVDILRDHRTLIAMIVVPIVLYPLLMLGSIQAVSIQAESLEQEQIRIGVLSDTEGQALHRLIEHDNRILRAQAEEHRAQAEQRTPPGERPDEPESDTHEAYAQPPAPLGDYEIIRLESRRELEQAISRRQLHIGVVIPDRDELVDAPDITNRIELLVDEEYVRGTFARRRLEEIIRRTEQRAVASRKKQLGLPPAFDDPFRVEVTDLSAPPSILGQVLPLILILMTITGAIYPAIDLTAGERERGTLESLMVSPVPVLELIVGKFLVVTTVAVAGAALNLASVTATVYFGGFQKIIARTGEGLPIGTMIVILLCLVPFAVLMSAIMIAVCSYARTFKEAQNYVTPVIIAVLIPGGIAALPATRLDGVMMVMPVGNMVLLARDLLLGTPIPAWTIAIVLLSTTLYAGAAVAIAASVFGQESVVFADAGSLKTIFSRRLIRPAPQPGVSMSLLLVALLFPTWFFVQSIFSPAPGQDAAQLLYATGTLMPILFIVLPALVAVYWKVNLRNAFALRVPSTRHFLAAALIGVSAWIPAYLINTLQQRLIGRPDIVMENAKQLISTLEALPLSSALVLVALVPALCEELLFRGFLLSGLASSRRKWTAILASAAIFGVFHFLVFKFAVTFALGVLLALICWQARSIIPAVTAHFLHNGIGVLTAVRPDWFNWLGVETTDATQPASLPLHVVLTGTAVCAVGILLIARPRRSVTGTPLPAIADA